MFKLFIISLKNYSTVSQKACFGSELVQIHYPGRPEPKMVPKNEKIFHFRPPPWPSMVCFDALPNRSTFGGGKTARETIYIRLRIGEGGEISQRAVA
jgi:hypothetical protein